MTEQGHGHTRRTRWRPRRTNLYQDVLEQSDRAAFAEAAAVEGLEDEVPLLRLLLRRQLAEHPENLEMTIKGMHLLVRMVSVQHGLSGADEAAFDERAAGLIEQVRRIVAGTEEVGDG